MDKFSKMRMTFIVTILFFFAPGISMSGAQTVTSQDPLLKIDAGRLDAMLDQISLLLDARSDDTGASAGDDDIDVEVRGAIKRYNVLLDLACSRTVLAGPPCGEIYAPPVGDVAPSDRALRDEIDDAMSRIHPLWVTVCEKLDNRAHSTCQME